MASRTVWHFAYGSNMNRAQMLSRTGKILEEHNASLPNYEVRFNKKVRGGTAGANIQPSSGKTVHGVLYKIEEGAMPFALSIVTRASRKTLPLSIEVASDARRWPTGSRANLHRVESGEGPASVGSVSASDAGRRG